MARSQVTLDIEEPYGSSIVQVIHSFDYTALSGSGDPSYSTRVLPAERIIPTGIMARYQVTLDIDEPDGSSIVQVIHSFDLTALS